MNGVRMGRDATTETEIETSGRGVSWSREAFRLAYRDHSGAVYAAASGFCGSRVAGDVTVEVFLHLWRHPEQQDSARASLRTSLLTVTHEVAADTIRSGTTRRTSEAQAATRPVTDLDGADQFEVAADGLSLGAQPLMMLRRDERDAIVTVHYGGCTYREAAVALGLDEGAVNSSIRAGLDHLRVALTRPRSPGSPRTDGGDDHRKASVSNEGLVAAFDSRQVVAHAQGIMMERDGISAGEASRALLQLSHQLGMSLPDCAEVVVSTAHDQIANPDSVDR